MKVIIIAGGKGERLNPLTKTIPKPMLKIMGKPILEHILNYFKKNNFYDFIISLYYLPQVITEYFGDGRKFGVKIQYIYDDEKQPFGTAGAILPAGNYIKDTFIVTYADILKDLNISKMLKQHQTTRAFATINVYKKYGLNPKSKVIFDKKRKITSFIERPIKNNLGSDFVWANASLYILEREIFSYIPKMTPSDFGHDIFPKLIAYKKPLYIFPSSSYFIDIGTIDKLMKVRKATKKTLIKE